MLASATAVLRRPLLLALLACASLAWRPAWAQEAGHEPLVRAGEDVLVSFRMADAPKTLTVAEARDGSYLVYRYGRPGDVEMTYPATLDTSSWQQFTYAGAHRGGGAGNAAIDLDYLTFENGDYTYTVYHEYAAEDDTTLVGVRIERGTDGRTFDLEGDAATLVHDFYRLRRSGKVRRRDEIRHR
jgi:hypothetical protein